MGMTLDAVIDRLYRDYLEPPSEQPAQTTLNGTLLAGTTTVTVTDNVLQQEEEDAIGAGTIIEIEQELMRVTAVSWPNLTVTRGALGTTAVAHATDGVPVIIASGSRRWNRTTVFDAVCDAIEALNANDLFVTVTSDDATSTNSFIEVPATTIDVLELYYKNTDSTVSTTRYIGGGWEFLPRVPTDISTTGKAIQLVDVPTSRTYYYIYKTYFTRPTDETYDLTDDAPNMPTRYVQLVLLSALINLVAGVDLDAVTTEYITDALEAQGFPVGSGRDLIRNLISVYEYRVLQESRRLNREYGMVVEQMDELL